MVQEFRTCFRKPSVVDHRRTRGLEPMKLYDSAIVVLVYAAIWTAVWSAVRS